MINFGFDNKRCAVTEVTCIVKNNLNTVSTFGTLLIILNNLINRSAHLIWVSFGNNTHLNESVYSVNDKVKLFEYYLIKKCAEWIRSVFESCTTFLGKTNLNFYTITIKIHFCKTCMNLCDYCN